MQTFPDIAVMDAVFHELYLSEIVPAADLLFALMEYNKAHELPTYTPSYKKCAFMAQRAAARNTNCGLLILKKYDTALGVLAFEVDNSILGQVINITHFIISEVYRGKGYGKAFLQSGIAYLKTTYKTEQFLISTMLWNKPAQHLYKSIGFEPVITQMYLKA